MPRFVFYLRSQRGDIERLGNVTALGPDRLLGSYQHKELLVDFPEPIVFWASDEGSTVGIAPLQSIDYAQ